MYQKLKAYKSDHGDYLVPQKYAKDKQLGLWVRTQRMNYKANKLFAGCKEKLESIGFIWDAGDDQWNEKINERIAESTVHWQSARKYSESIGFVWDVLDLSGRWYLLALLNNRLP